MAHQIRTVISLGIFLLLAVSTIADDAMKELAEMLHNTCVGETGVSEDLIAKANKGDFSNDGNLKCYMKCIFVQSTGMDDDGTFNAEAMIDMLPDSMKSHATVIRACQNEGGADPCDKAFNINKCFYQKNPATYMLV